MILSDSTWNSGPCNFESGKLSQKVRPSSFLLDSFLLTHPVKKFTRETASYQEAQKHAGIRVILVQATNFKHDLYFF